MPDLDKLQALSEVLEVSVNELLAGEKIGDAENFVKKADENLIAALAGDSAFGLQDRIVFFKRKWIREHKALIAFWVFVWGALCAVGVFMKQPVFTALLPIAGIVIYGHARNQMMIYVEDRAFISEKAPSGR